MAEFPFRKVNDPAGLHDELAAAGVPVETCRQGRTPDELFVVVPDGYDTPANRRKVEALVRVHDPARAQVERDRVANERQRERGDLATLANGSGVLTPEELSDALRLLARATLRGVP